MRVPSFPHATLALALTIATAARAEEACGLMIHWSSSIKSPAIPTTNSHWFIGVAPLALNIEEDSEILITQGDLQQQAAILHIDPSHRLCLIESTEPIEGATPLEFASAPMPGAGSNLHCSKPGATCPTAVAGKEYSIKGEPLSSPLLRLRISNAEEFCEPGTPLICGNGKLFGILTEKESSIEGEAHAIPVCSIRKMITEFKRFGRSGKVWIGLVFEDKSNTPQVIDVRDGSPADKATIKQGDVILTIAGHELASLNELTQAVHVLTAGDEVEVTVLRGLTQKTLSLTPEFAEPPSIAGQ